MEKGGEKEEQEKKKQQKQQQQKQPDCKEEVHQQLRLSGSLIIA